MLSHTASEVSTLPLDLVHNLSLGIESTDQPDVRVLFDDVLLSTSPVSCDLAP